MLLMAATVFSQSKNQRTRAIERQRFAAMTMKDTAALHLMLADDLIYVHSNGLLEDKAKHIANIVSGKIVYSTMEPTEIKVRVHGRTAFINGIVQVAGSLAEKTVQHSTAVHGCLYKKAREMAASSLAVIKIGMNAVEDLGNTHKTAPGVP